MLRISPVSASIFALAMLASLTSPLEAQWISDSTTNTPVCTLVGSQHMNPKICSDGANGAIIVWQDTRGTATNIYAQRLGADGKAMWTANGIRLATPANTNALQEAQVIASDGAGGAYVVWEDLRNPATGIDLYGQHIHSDGTLAGGTAGFAVCTAQGDQTTPVICADGNGGAFVAWTDSRPTVRGNSPDLYLNHLSGGGAQFGGSGRIADTAAGSQRNPAICDDGSGGCFLAWEDGSALPIAIHANHYSAGGTAYWGVHGFLVYQTDCGTCYTANATHVSVRRDGTQLMLAWEVTSITNSTQNIMAARIRGANPYDSTQLWSHAVDVTGDIPYDQVWPQIFSDDSAIAGGPDFRGILVPFEYAWPGSADNWDLTMIRVLGDGSTQLPGDGTVYSITSQPHGQVGFQAVPINSNILMVWNDARFGSNPDTCIYAQMFDKLGNRFFPTYRTNSTWGIPICHRTTASKQVAIAPRTDGAIIAWADYRAGATQANIYAQLLLTNGERSLDVVPPQVSVTSQSPSFDGSLCNSQCTDVLALDSGLNQTGIDSVIPISVSNMKFTVASFAAGADSVPFSFCVKDSFQAGSAEIALADEALNRDTFSISYCPIADTGAPYVTWDSTTQWISIHIRDDRPWDRGLRSITLTDTSNVYFVPPLNRVIAAMPVYTSQAAPWDPSKPSQFCISATDTAGNISQQVCFSREVAGIADEIAPKFSLSVRSGSTPGAMELRLEGAPSAKVTVFDVLGRTVDQFSMQEAYDWNPSGLPAGAYELLASNGARQTSAWVIRN